MTTEVGVIHADADTALAVRHLLRDRMTVERAVVSVIVEPGPAPEYGAVLWFYPADAGQRTAAALLGAAA